MNDFPDFTAHNEEQAAVWQAFWGGQPTRVPMTCNCSARNTIFNDIANPEGYDFEQFFHDPRAMFTHGLRRQHYIRHYLYFDQEMGLPQTWSVGVDLQNSFEAMWWGCPLHFRAGQVPDTTPILRSDNKRMLFDQGMPEPFSGWLARAWEYYEQFQGWAKTETFMDRPIAIGAPPGFGCDGVLTIAVALMDPMDLMIEMYSDPDFVHEFLGFITEATIRRIKAFRQRLGQPETTSATGLADDAIQMLSHEHYRDFVLPYHKRLVEEFGAEGPNSIHLCGDATHHFRFIRDELKVMSFDTGFPVDHGWLRQELGPDVTIHGGPSAELVRSGPVSAIKAEAKRILQSGIMAGGKFVLREGNNIAPYTPPEHVRAMYETCREFGRY